MIQAFIIKNTALKSEQVMMTFLIN